MDENSVIILFVMMVLVVVAGIVGIATYSDRNGNVEGIDQFDSEEELEDFVDAEEPSFFETFVSELAQPDQQLSGTQDAAGPRLESDAATSGDGGSYTTGQTNVQVIGIDEPDSVKLTDGASYYAPPRNNYRPPVVTPLPGPVVDVDTRSIEPIEVEEETKVIDTDNTSDPEVVDNIDRDGKLLRSGDRLVIFDSDRITGYDISEPENPETLWEKNVSGRTTIESARMSEDQLLFVMNTRLEECPVVPIEEEEISCEDVYYPTELDSGSGVYSVVNLNHNSGETESSTSFVGSNRDTTVYVSNDNLYLSYRTSEVLVQEFIDEELEGLDLDNETKEEIRQIETDDIDRRYEFFSEVTQITRTEDRRGYEETRVVEEAYESFISDKARETQQTVVVRVGLDQGQIDPEAVGNVPGYTLNQYSFDENDGNIRIATTIPRAGNSESVNDMYVLNQESLEIRGSVKDMAEGQRVYAVRFIDDKGYIITFRQIDPLHVIDIEDPDNPEEVGTLELPGFSDYLHKIGDGKLLGIGESQDRRAKMVLFDVSNETEPKVSDSVVLDNEFGTRISEDFRSFLEDDEKGVYYIPANNGVYVLEEDEGELDVVESISTPTSAERVRIVGEDLYIYHGNGVLSVDRDTYENEGEVTFNQDD